jgi:SH3-like domain-containing protein
MAARRLVLRVALTAFPLTLAASISPRIAHADDAVPDSSAGSEVENAKRSFIGQINASSVLVRSGPRDDAYQTTKLDKGTEVTVIGIKFDWLKIVPPPGSFAYVPKVYVERHGDGSVGRATREITARVGSDLTPVKIAAMAKVEEGDEVQIIGEADEYFKIKPPAGSALWVNKQFVDPVRPVPDANSTAPQLAQQNPATGTPAAPATADNTQAPATTQPGGAQASAAAAPATQPAADAAAKASDQFDKLEGDYSAATDKPITDQPVAELQTGYEGLLKNDALPDSMRRIAEVRVATLKMRNEAKQEYLAFKENQDKSAERRKALGAEQEEIESRLKQSSVTLYAAVGTLRTSSIQHAGTTLYRITDPETGRTVAYIRTRDTAPMALLGQFVGVKGAITTDDSVNMKMIENPTLVEAVDQAKVNGSVAAQILPPSLLPRSSEASTSGN